MKRLPIELLYSKLYDRDRRFAINLYLEFINDEFEDTSDEKHSLKKFMRFVDDISLNRDIIVCTNGFDLTYETTAEFMATFLDEKVCERYGLENNGPFNGWLHDMYKFLILDYNPKAKCEICEYCKCVDMGYKTFYCLAENNQILGVDYAPKKSPNWCAFKNEKYTIRKGG